MKWTGVCCYEGGGGGRGVMKKGRGCVVMKGWGGGCYEGGGGEGVMKGAGGRVL